MIHELPKPVQFLPSIQTLLKDFSRLDKDLYRSRHTCLRYVNASKAPPKCLHIRNDCSRLVQLSSMTSPDLKTLQDSSRLDINF